MILEGVSPEPNEMSYNIYVYVDYVLIKLWMSLMI